MRTENLQQTPFSSVPTKQLSYNEVVEFLDAHWQKNTQDFSLNCIKQLNKALGSLAQKTNAIFVTGSNGKSLTAHFTAKLLREEGLSVGILQEPHILTYNERFSYNGELIQNKIFTDIANKVITTVRDLGIEAGTRDILVMMSLLYFAQCSADVTVFEIGNEHARHPANICTPKIVAVTRVTDDASAHSNRTDEAYIRSVLSCIKKEAQVISADQGKLNLQFMEQVTEELGGKWGMPIRKLALLSYPFEQLHGRCAALAERVSSLYVNNFTNARTTTIGNTLLVKQKGKRGRPTLETKRQLEINPSKTMEQFWKEHLSTLPGRFQLLEKEKPMILLDNASDLDAFQNLLLGIRLLHYQKPLKGLVLILSNNNDRLNKEEFLRLLRYFFKKTSGNIIICASEPMPGNTGKSWDVDAITQDLRGMKVKASSAPNLSTALQTASQLVDERDGLVVISGSVEVIANYWHTKGLKKLHHSEG